MWNLGSDTFSIQPMEESVNIVLNMVVDAGFSQKSPSFSLDRDAV